MKIFFALTFLTVTSLAAGEYHKIDQTKPEILEMAKLGTSGDGMMKSFKVARIHWAEKEDQLYRINAEYRNKGDKQPPRTCTIHVDASKPELKFLSLSCTIPAPIRRRRPHAKKVTTTEAPAGVTESSTMKDVSSGTTAVPVTTDDIEVLFWPYNELKTKKTTTVAEDESSLNEIDSEPTRKPKRHVLYTRQPIRTTIPARNYYTQPGQIYYSASQPIVYTLQPQYVQRSQQPYYQPYQTYYTSIAY